MTRFGPGLWASVVFVAGPTVALATNLSVPFEPNVGQLDPRVAYRARTFAGPLLVTREGALQLSLAPPRGAVANVQPAQIVETPVAGTPDPAAGDAAVTRVNYLARFDVPLGDRFTLVPRGRRTHLGFGDRALGRRPATPYQP
jgi:hypothetical protein